MFNNRLTLNKPNQVSDLLSSIVPRPVNIPPKRDYIQTFSLSASKTNHSLLIWWENGFRSVMTKSVQLTNGYKTNQNICVSTLKFSQRCSYCELLTLIHEHRKLIKILRRRHFHKLTAKFSLHDTKQLWNLNVRLPFLFVLLCPFLSWCLSPLLCKDM